jgi:hypothetical protein
VRIRFVSDLRLPTTKVAVSFQDDKKTESAKPRIYQIKLTNKGLNSHNNIIEILTKL